MKRFGNTLLICLMGAGVYIIARPWVQNRADVMIHIYGVEGYELAGWGRSRQDTDGIYSLTSITIGKDRIPGSAKPRSHEFTFTKKEIRQLTDSIFPGYQSLGHILDNMWHEVETRGNKMFHRR